MVRLLDCGAAGVPATAVSTVVTWDSGAWVLFPRTCSRLIRKARTDLPGFPECVACRHVLPPLAIGWVRIQAQIVRLTIAGRSSAEF
jgi:hypothetical protein